MSTRPETESKNNFARLAVGGFVLLHVLCCGLPLLIAAGVLGGFGSVSLFAGNGWLAGAAGVLGIALVVWYFRRRTPGTGRDGTDCCAPAESTPPQSAAGEMTVQGRAAADAMTGRK
jgi:hypothetical protein